MRPSYCCPNFALLLPQLRPANPGRRGAGRRLRCLKYCCETSPCTSWAPWGAKRFKMFKVLLPQLCPANPGRRGARRGLRCPRYCCGNFALQILGAVRRKRLHPLQLPRAVRGWNVPAALWQRCVARIRPTRLQAVIQGGRSFNRCFWVK